jgi:hypothetical protein
MKIEAPEIAYTLVKGSAPSGRFFAISGTAGKLDIRPHKVASIYVDLNREETAQGKTHDSDPAFKSSICIISPCIQSIQSTYKQSDKTAQGSPYHEEVLKS